MKTLRRLIVPLGIVVGCLLFIRNISGDITVAYYKLTGKTACSWSRIFTAGSDGNRMGTLRRDLGKAVQRDGTDPRLNLEHFRTATRSFWIKRSGTGMNGQELLTYLLAEHQWMSELNPSEAVRPGDIVIDCGAHIGVFTHTALARGAAKVIAVEPEPVNLECLRRNFADEIKGGRVVLAQLGVWDSAGTMRLAVAGDNSGENSMVLAVGSETVEVPVTTIDVLVGQLGLPRVDFIKMDIEGAERHALRGAEQTLKRWTPRLMLDTYHLPDDPVVLPKLIMGMNAAYHEKCGPCQANDDGPALMLIPHVTYYF